MNPENDNARPLDTTDAGESSGDDVPWDSQLDHPRQTRTELAALTVNMAVETELCRMLEPWGDGDLPLELLPRLLAGQLGQVEMGVNEIQESQEVPSIVPNLVRLMAIAKAWLVRCPALREPMLSQKQDAR